MIPVYQGYSSQYGHGLGNVLGGVVRAALPFVGKMAKRAGAELLDSGLSYLKDKINTKRRKVRQVKRAASQPKHHKRRKPPGKPVRRSTRKRPARDIFTP